MIVISLFLRFLSCPYCGAVNTAGGPRGSILGTFFMGVGVLIFFLLISGMILYKLALMVRNGAQYDSEKMWCGWRQRSRRISSEGIKEIKEEE